MKTSLLLKLSLVTALVGIATLAWLSAHLEPAAIPISSVHLGLLDSWVKVSGFVIEQKDLESLSLLTLKDENASIRVASRARLSNLTGKKITVIGKVSEWKGELQIEASQISHA